jgi:uncharacterized circularly permuted ATP-grasp superfamily protein
LAVEPLPVETPSSPAWDEVFESPGVPRPLYRGIVEVLNHYDAQELRSRFEQLARTFTDRGVTFALGGEERPFPLDLIPRVIAAREWDALADGLRQRVRALEAFLDDVYGEGRVFSERVVPRALVTSSPNFRREAFGAAPAHAARITVSGIDVIRDEWGHFRVLEDNVRIPSGVSYVIENRRAMTQSFAGLFAHQRVHPVDDYPARLLAALRRSAPEAVADPTVVVLTPGVHNSAYFEHVLLARMMGVELVEGRDLVTVANRVLMRTTQGERPVHVIYRRVDDEWLDPLQFRPDSMLGVPGLVNAARAQMVTVANAIGNGVADDKLLYTYVPDLVRFFLNEEPLLDNVETYRLEDPDVLDEVTSHLERYVIKPVDGSGGKGIVIGPQADEATLALTRVQVRAEPRRFIAQRPVALSTLPTFVGDQLAPRHVDLRPFAINDGTDVWVLSGGLTRVALPEGTLVVNSSQGGGSKDTWVLADEDEPVLAPMTLAEVSPRPTRPAPAGLEVARQRGPFTDDGGDQ